MQVGASADDATETSGVVSLTAVAIINDSTTEWNGFRFQGVSIPGDATVVSAVAEFVVLTGNDDPSHAIFGEAADNAAVFTTAASSISGRSRTTATVTWTSGGLGADDATYFSAPDLSAIVQEIISRPGWVSGNSLVLLVQGSADASRDLAIRTYDFDPAKAAKLTITYTTPAAPRSMYHHLVGGMR